jgi:hypothetical protein
MPKSLLEQAVLDRVSDQGVRPAGPAVPPATVSPPVRTTLPAIDAVPSATGSMPAANPITGVPVVGVPVQISPAVPDPGPEADVRIAPQSGQPAGLVAPVPAAGEAASPRQSSLEMGPTASPAARPVESKESAAVRVLSPVVGLPAELVPRVVDQGPETRFLTPVPWSQKPVRVFAPETFVAKAAMPSVLESIRGVPAEVMRRQGVEAVAQIDPSRRVTVTVPPAFAFDPAEVFAAVDAVLEPPPRHDLPDFRPVGISAETTGQASEDYVAEQYQRFEAGADIRSRVAL